MFAKGLVSVVLGTLLLCSISLWAKDSQELMRVSKLEVQNQLSISAHQVGEARYLSQLGAKKATPSNVEKGQTAPMPLLSSLGVMVFGLMYFVLRSSRKRIK